MAEEGTITPQMYRLIANLLARDMMRVEDKLEDERNEDVRANLEAKYTSIEQAVDWLDSLAVKGATK